MYVIHFSADGELQSGGAELLESWRDGGREGLIWVDLEDEAEDAQLSLLRSFYLHPLAIQDAMRTRHPPKIEVFGDVVFLLLRGLDAAQRGLEFGVIQLALFAGDGFLITRHSGRSVSVETVRRELLADPSGEAQTSALSLAVVIANKLARRYVDLLLSLESRLDEIEDEMFDDPHDGLLNELTRYRSKLRQIQRVTRYHTMVAERLRDQRVELNAAELVHELVDLYEQNERAGSLAELYHHIAQDLSDSYLALSSHRLNKVMQVLTVFTVIFVPLTFIAGIYGMNFENMPELKSSIGYFAVIGVMLLIATVQLVYFRLRKWI